MEFTLTFTTINETIIDNIKKLISHEKKILSDAYNDTYPHEVIDDYELNEVRLKQWNNRKNTYIYNSPKIIDLRNACISKPLVDNIGSTGLDILDDIRENNPSLENVSSSLFHVNDLCPINGSSVDVSIKEDYARESDLFCGTLKRVIVVPASFLNRFITLETEISKEPRGFLGIGGGKVNEVTSKYIFNIDKMFEIWKQDGFPLRWRVDD